MPGKRKKSTVAQSDVPVNSKSPKQSKLEKENRLESADHATGSNTKLLQNKLDGIFMVNHSLDLLIEFWEHAVQLNKELPQDAFTALESLKLTGPFNFISDFYNKNVQNESRTYLTDARFPTDLPEMQTILVYGGGRFCHWRDAPSDAPRYLIHVSAAEEHFPAFTIAGDANPFCVIHYLLMMVVKPKQLKQFDHFFPDKYRSMDYDQKYLQTLRKARAKESVGRPFHELGIKVDVSKKGIGYRPLSDDNNENNRLKKDMETLGTTDNEETKKTVKEKLYKIYSWVQFANDEMDFGMGLEFGHDLFVSNYACFDGMAKSVLKTSYELLGRKEFAAILEKQWEVGRRPQ